MSASVTVVAEMTTTTTTKKKKKKRNSSIITGKSDDDEDGGDNEGAGEKNKDQEEVVFLLYTGQSRTKISREVTHVRVHPSVTKILPRAFEDCTNLRELDLCYWNHEADYDDVGTMLQLETIGGRAFGNCFALERIQLPTSVKSISRGAFEDCIQLRDVELNEGLTRIKTRAFGNCVSLERIILPTTVKSISHCAFQECTRLWEVELNEGLEMIDSGAFANCSALEYIKIPSTVKTISSPSASIYSEQQSGEVDCRDDDHNKDGFVSSLKMDSWGRIQTSFRSLGTFQNCVNLRVVEFCEGVQKIGPSAFYRCSSLEHVIVPSTVESIDGSAFDGCTSLVTVEFCEDIEDFVASESMQEWWKDGLSQEALKAFCFFTRYNFPKRMSMLQISNWQIKIHDMLRRLPSIVGTCPISVPSWTGSESCITYLSSINAKLTYYETLKDAAVLLELSIWKSKLVEHGGISLQLVNHGSGAISRAEHRINCGATVIIPKVLAFLVCE